MSVRESPAFPSFTHPRRRALAPRSAVPRAWPVWPSGSLLTASASDKLNSGRLADPTLAQVAAVVVLCFGCLRFVVARRRRLLRLLLVLLNCCCGQRRAPLCVVLFHRTCLNIELTDPEKVSFVSGFFSVLPSAGRVAAE